jgi:hypothetical protein
LGGVLDAIKLKNLQKGIDVSNELKSKINWFNIDLAAQADFAIDFPP